MPDYGSPAFLQGIRNDFRLFTHALWAYHQLDRVAPLDDVDYDICHWLQHGPPRRGVLAFRGQGKSYKTNAYATWRLYLDPRLWVLLTSASLTKAKDSLHLCRQWIKTTPWLQHLSPRPDQRDGAEKFDVGPAPPASKNASISAVGITGQITGHRAHLIIPDDVETPETSRTVDARRQLREQVKEFDDVVTPKGEIVFLGTPQHEETLYAELDKAGVVFRTWPARYPTLEERTKIIHLAPSLGRKLEEGRAAAGDATAPQRFSDDLLREREAHHGRSRFAMQYMLLMGLGELTYPLKLADLIVFPVHPDRAPTSIAWGTRDADGSTAIEEIPSVGLGSDRLYRPIMVSRDWLPYQGTKMFLDPAGGSADGDETAWAAVGQLHGYLYVKDVGAYRGGHTTDNLERVVMAARAARVNDLYIEKNFGGEFLARLIEPILRRHFLAAGSEEAKKAGMPEGWACAVDLVHSSKQKELRIIDALEPVMNQHRLVVHEKVAADQVLTLQLTRITRARGCLDHDDRLDALAGCVERFADVLHQDAAVQVARLSQEQQLELMRPYLELYGRLPADSWIQRRQ